MIINKGLVLVIPEKSNLGHFSEGEVSTSIGIVEDIAEDVAFALKVIKLCSLPLSQRLRSLAGMFWKSKRY